MYINNKIEYYYEREFKNINSIPVNDILELKDSINLYSRIIDYLLMEIVRTLRLFTVYLKITTTTLEVVFEEFAISVFLTSNIANLCSRKKNYRKRL